MLKYPSKKICTQTLSRLYTKHKIHHKKIKITKLLTPVLRPRIKKQTEQMAEQLAPMISKGFRIVYLDETMVTKSTMPTREWTGLKHQIKVDY